MKNTFEENNSLQSGSELDNNKPLNVIKRKYNKRKKTPRAYTARTITAPIGAPLNDDSRANRPTRIPIGTQKRLSVPQRPGYVRRWVNDIDERIEMFKQAGYEIVADEAMPIGDQASKDSQPLGATRRKSVGRGRYAYLMEIPEDLYREDQLNKIKRNQEKIASITQIDPKKDQYGSINVNANTTNREG